jgi:enoyl-CoA hydratase/carnithine racemase
VSSEPVIYERDPEQHVARLTMHNPGKRNAFSLAMADAFARCLDEIAGDDDIKVVLLRGSDGTFTTGADMNEAYNWYAKEGEKRRPSQRRRLSVDRHTLRVFHEFLSFNKATVGQVESYALGAGLELALSCDLAVVGADCKLGMPATRFLGPVLGNLHLFFYRMGPALTKELLLTGRTITGAELADRGIFTRVVPPDRVAEEAEDLVEQVRRMPADGIVIAKEAYRLVEQDIGLQHADVAGSLFHAFATNLRFEPDEYNFVSERAKRGTSAAFDSRDQFYEGEGGEPPA